MSNHKLNMAADLTIVKVKGKDCIRALGTWVVVEAVDINKTAGGVQLPSTSAESRKWVVVSVGNKVDQAIKPGDEVEILGNLKENVFPFPLRYDGAYFFVEGKWLVASIEKDAAWKGSA